MRLLGRRLADTGERVACGCCERDYPRSTVHELGATPGVYVCRRCALWMASRISRRNWRF